MRDGGQDSHIHNSVTLTCEEHCDTTALAFSCLRLVRSCDRTAMWLLFSFFLLCFDELKQNTGGKRKHTNMWAFHYINMYIYLSSSRRIHLQQHEQGCNEGKEEDARARNVSGIHVPFIHWFYSSLHDDLTCLTPDTHVYKLYINKHNALNTTS